MYCAILSSDNEIETNDREGLTEIDEVTLSLMGNSSNVKVRINAGQSI